MTKDRRQNRRLERQFRAIERFAPVLRRPMAALRSRGWWIVRLPVAMVFVVGGLLSFLPFLGLWMLPFGLLLLAVDLPVIRGPVSAMMIRARRRITVWWYHRGKRRGRKAD